MTNRERIIRTARCEKADRPPFFFLFGPWGETLERWRREGLAEGRDWREGFGFDAGIDVVNVNLGYSPAFDFQELEERENTRVIRDEYGITMEVNKRGATIPRYLDYPVKTRADWEALKKRLDPDDPARFPPNWQELAEKYNGGEAAVQIGTYPYGLFGTPRDMMGVEALLLGFYDQPDLIKDMMDYLTDFWLAVYEKVCRDVKIDIIHIWEDMSGKAGPLVSPEMTREFMVPNYRKIRAFADANGIPVFSLDTDGDCSLLVPPLLEGGVNLLFPFEVAAGCDVNEYRAKFPTLGMMGGFDKREIAKGPEKIDRELARVEGAMRKGGYIPALDHLPHPEISWADFQYFTNALRRMAFQQS